MKQKIDKQNLLVLVLIVLAVSAFCLNVEFDINDGLWNFSNVYKMSIGLEIYRDLNVIITPLFFYISKSHSFSISSCFICFSGSRKVLVSL